MKLRELLKDVAYTQSMVSLDSEVKKICYDSRAVEPGDVFVAIRGYATDGHQYIDTALKKGALAVVCNEAASGVPAVFVDDTRIALAEMAANYFGHPADSMKLIGITGTNGKTTTTYLIKHMLDQAGYKVGLIGTNQNLIGSNALETERTTPESFELHALFAKMRDAGCTHVVMEVSSHSLALKRVHGLHFAVGVFTNLTQDHMDFHETMEEYRRVKSILFTMCDNGVINLDDEASAAMLAAAACPCFTYSAKKDGANLTAKNIRLHADGVDFLVSTMEELVRVKLGIPGMFSVENALAAIGAMVMLGVPLADAAQAMATACGVKGRVEVVPTDTDYTVLIDYAHSPDGVENVLKAVRGFAKGRVIALFGCGGDRDTTKRPKMGAIAAEFANLCIVTSDNPRTEDPEAIVRDILGGMKGSRTPKKVIVDRVEAIHWALDNAKTDDVIVLMGKGHETYQEVNHVKHHMDEREIVADYLKKK